MKLFLVYGESTDGTYMSVYSEFNVVSAENETTAMQYDDNLIGKKRIIKYIGETTLPEGIVEHTYTRDY